MFLLDQRYLPHQIWLECTNSDDVTDAISKMVVRGAPAIAIAGAYGLLMGFRQEKIVPKYLKRF